MQQYFQPAKGVCGELDAPPDKSISHRAAIFAAMSSGRVAVANYLDAADTNSTLAAIAQLGATVQRSGSDILITGVGLRGARVRTGSIDVGNAGTLMRLLPGWLAAQPEGEWVLDGDASIRQRPVDRIIEPLRQMGAVLRAEQERFAPLAITAAGLRGITYLLPIASAQVKSCLLIAGLLAHSATTVSEPVACRDHTERMLLAAGVQVARVGDAVTVQPTESLVLPDQGIPGDFSSAAFWLALGAIIPAAEVTVRGVNVNWTRVGFAKILQRMGVKITGQLEAPGSIVSAEPVSDLTVTGTAGLHGTVVDADEVPLAIDELPLVALVGCFAAGETVVRGAAELKVKESNRIAAVVDGLSNLGANITATSDGFTVHGTGELRGGELHAGGDHRMAMLGALAGVASRKGVTVHGMEAAAVSYPTFVSDLKRVIS